MLSDLLSGKGSAMRWRHEGWMGGGRVRGGVGLAPHAARALPRHTLREERGGRRAGGRLAKAGGAGADGGLQGAPGTAIGAKMTPKTARLTTAGQACQLASEGRQSISSMAICA